MILLPIGGKCWRLELALRVGTNRLFEIQLFGFGFGRRWSPIAVPNLQDGVCDWLAFGVFLASEGTAAQNGNAHGSEIVAADDGPIDIDQLAPLPWGLALDRNIGGPTAAESR